MSPIVRMKWLDEADQSIALPRYETANAAGADLRANLNTETRAEGLAILPGRRVLVPTGLAMEIPTGFEVQIRPRSGLALKHGISIPNSPGTIDADYRGPVGVIMINFGTDVFVVRHGDRIAQMIVAPVAHANFELVVDLSETSRGEGGFGSTGRT